MKNSVLGLIVSLIAVSAFANEPAQNQPLKADREAVDSSCSQDAQTAGCANEVVGKGLLKCLYTYKRGHKEFKFSDSCKESMKKLHADRREMKKAKK